MRFLEESRLTDLLHADDLVLCTESEKRPEGDGERFFEVCKKRGLKANVDKSKVMMLGGEEGYEGDIRVDRALLERVSEFKYLRCVLDNLVQILPIVVS